MRLSAVLVEPIQVIRTKLELQVGVLDPQKRRISREPRDTATFYRPIREGPLQASQFPDELRDVQGIMRKPAGW